MYYNFINFTIIIGLLIFIFMDLFGMIENRVRGFVVIGGSSDSFGEYEQTE